MNQDACSYGAGFFLKYAGEPERGVLLPLPIGLEEREHVRSTREKGRDVRLRLEGARQVVLPVISGARNQAPTRRRGQGTRTLCLR